MLMKACALLCVWRHQAGLKDVARKSRGERSKRRIVTYELLLLVVQEFSTAAKAAEPLRQVLEGRDAMYFPDSSSLSSSGLIEGELVPQGTESVDLHSVGLADGQHAVLLLASQVPRAFSQRDRGWAAAIARKLSSLQLRA